MTAWRIVCDVGGTHIRIARSAANFDRSSVVVSSTHDCSDLGALLLGYAKSFDDCDQLKEIAVAAAGPVELGQVQLTNSPLAISEESLREIFDSNVSLRIINDLEAVAWSLPWLSDRQIATIRKSESMLSGNLLVVNVGTGFGAATLVKSPHGWQAVGCEPGHMKLASSFSVPAGPVCIETSIEDVFSGLALRDVSGFSRFNRSGNVIPPIRESKRLFTELSATSTGREVIRNMNALLGQICGDLVLSSGAWGGVYTCGGVAAALFEHADPNDFSSAFCSKGPMSGRMRRVNVHHIAEPYPALIGLSAIPL